jgi:Uma2 family endonuclease
MQKLALRYPPYYTAADYERWEDDWELIQGIPYAMSPRPSLAHQKLSRALIKRLIEHLKECPTCDFLHEVEWRLADHTILHPDIVVVCRESGHPNYLDFPPSLLVEILSPGTERKDRELKFQLYQAEGVPYYLLAQPRTGTLEAFALDDDGNYQSMDEGPWRFALPHGCAFELPAQIDTKS